MTVGSYGNRTPQTDAGRQRGSAMSNTARLITVAVLAIGALAALFFAARQRDETRQYVGVAVAVLCYLGIFLEVKWAYDAATGRDDHGAPSL
jgi:hypothetical protein